MSKFLLVCLTVLLVAMVSEAGPWGRGQIGRRRQRGDGAMMMKGRGRGGHGAMMMKGRGRGGQWRRKWAIGRKDGVIDVDANTFFSDDNIPVHSLEMIDRRPVVRRPWKLRRMMRRRHKFQRMQQANGTAENDVISAWKAKWMAKKHRRQDRWKAMLARKGCFCLTPDKLKALRLLIIERGLEVEFPEIVPDDFVDDEDDGKVDDEDKTIDNVTTVSVEETDTKLPILS